MSIDLSSEAIVVVNGHPLTQVQSMVLRVALTTFLMEMDSPEMRREMGTLADGYLVHGRRIIELIMETKVG